MPDLAAVLGHPRGEIRPGARSPRTPRSDASQIDPKLLEQPWSPRLPLSADITFHLVPAVALIVDLLFLSPPYTIAFLPALGLSACIASGYWLWIEECYRHNNFYPYPMLEILNAPQRLLLFSTSAMIMTLTTGGLVWLYHLVNGKDGQPRGAGNVHRARSGNVKGD